MTGLVLTVVLAVVIGISLGLLGGGGSILAVPLLVYVAGLPAREAIATSLLVVGVTSAVAVLPHARAGRVRWRTGLVFGLAGMAGAYGGGRLADAVPASVLLTAFALMMLATAIAMIRGRRGGPDDSCGPAGRDLPLLKAVAVGAAVGLVSGLVGAGGGFLIVPALTLIGGLPMAAAVGTSLAVISMQTLAGFAGHLASVHVNWPLAAAVTAAAVGGSLAGSRLVGRIPATTLRKAFGWFVLAMGVLVLTQQLPRGLVTQPMLSVAIGAVAFAAATASIWRSRRRAARPVGPASTSTVPVTTPVRTQSRPGRAVARIMDLGSDRTRRGQQVDSEAWDARYAGSPDLVWTAEPNRFVVEETAGLKPGRALDLAAGEGRNAIWLAERGWQVTAVDFSPVAMERGRDLARQRGVEVDWQVSDLTTYEPPADSFDLVLIAYLHLPAPDLATTLHRARRALRSGGTLVLVGHDLANLTNGVGGPQDPTVLQTPETVVAELDGLRIRRADTARRPVQVDDRTVDALDTVVVATRP